MEPSEPKYRSDTFPSPPPRILNQSAREPHCVCLPRGPASAESQAYSRSPGEREGRGFGLERVWERVIAVGGGFRSCNSRLRHCLAFFFFLLSCRMIERGVLFFFSPYSIFLIKPPQKEGQEIRKPANNPEMRPREMETELFFFFCEFARARRANKADCFLANGIRRRWKRAWGWGGEAGTEKRGGRHTTLCSIQRVRRVSASSGFGPCCFLNPRAPVTVGLRIWPTRVSDISANETSLTRGSNGCLGLQLTEVKKIYGSLTL